MTASDTLQRTDFDIDTAPPPPRPSRGLIVTGVLAVVIGGLWLLDVLDVVDLRLAVMVPIVLAVIGVALIVAAFDGRSHTGLIIAGVFVTLLTLAAAVTPPDAFEGGVGYRDIRVTSQAELADRYYLGVGDMLLDLSDLTLTESAEITASIGAGEMRILLPPQVPVDIHAVARAGHVDLLGEGSQGIGAAREYTSNGFDAAPVTLTLDLNVTAGNIEVDR